MSKIIISLPDQLLVDLTDFSKAQKYNRSEAIRAAIRAFIYTKNVQQPESPSQ